MAEMRINTQLVLETANKIETYKNSFNDLLNNFHNKVSNINAAWESSASQATIDGINRLKPHFEEYSNTVETYVSYLKATAEKYETTEATNKHNAETTAEFI